MAGWDWQASSALEEALHPSTSKEYVLPRYDLALFNSDKFSAADGGESVLNNFMKQEKNHLAKGSYLQTVQTEVTLAMRIQTAQWMLEVCEEEKCSTEIFPLAVSFLDRFLSKEAVHKNQVQALATACLFLASKVKLPRQFDGGRLVLYTDESVSISDLLSWELLVLNRLDWDLASLTAYDFLDQYVHRLGLPADQVHGLRASLKYLIEEAAVDFRMAILAPSTIAAVCLQMASAQVFGKFHATYQRVAMVFEKITAKVMDPSKPYSAAVQDLSHRYQMAFTKPQPPPVLRPLQLLPAFSSTFTQISRNDQDGSTSKENYAPPLSSTPTDMIDVMLL